MNEGFKDALLSIVGDKTSRKFIIAGAVIGAIVLNRTQELGLSEKDINALVVVLVIYCIANVIKALVDKIK